MAGETDWRESEHDRDQNQTQGPEILTEETQRKQTKEQIMSYWAKNERRSAHIQIKTLIDL